jgi:hypothetical protein
VTFIYPNKPVRFYDLKRFAATITPEEWVVQPKYDGHRAHPYCDEAGDVTVYGRNGKPLNLAKGDWKWLSLLEIPRPYLLDGELTRDGRLLLWDYAILGGASEFREAYENRLKKLLGLVPKPLSKGRYTVGLVETAEARKWAEVLLKHRGDPTVEGLVFKKRSARDLWGQFSTAEVPSQMKFKFSKAERQGNLAP